MFKFLNYVLSIISFLVFFLLSACSDNGNFFNNRISGEEYDDTKEAKLMKYYSRLENVSRIFADREKDIKRRFNKKYLRYGRNDLNDFIRSGRNITLRDGDRYLLKDEIHDLVDELTRKKIEIKNNDHINIIEQSIIDLKVMYICLMQGLAMSTHKIITNEQVEKGQQQINTRDDNTTELSIIATCDGVKLMRPFVTN